MNKNPKSFAHILKDPDQYQVQILYTQIDRKENKPTIFRTYGYGVNDNHYFDPGETVALPAALLALEKLNKHQVDKFTPVYISRFPQSECSVFSDSTSPDGLASIAHYIKKMFIGNDQDAFNQIYDFIELADFNDVLHKKGYTATHINQRLSTNAPCQNQNLDYEVTFVGEGDTLFKQEKKFKLNDKGQIEASNRLEQVPNSMQQQTSSDSKNLNVLALKDAHQLLKAIFFPESLQESERFDLTEKDYQFLYQYMSQLPVETSFPPSYPVDLDDGTMKYFLFGGRNTRLPRHVRLFNKVGQGDGYLLDHAYIVDFEKGVEFMLSAVIYCNPNGKEVATFEYELIGKRFMEDLGKVIFEYELNRKKSSRPELSKYEVEYDK